MSYCNQKITWLGVTAITFGIFGAYLIKFKVEPWVIETVCRELLKCG